MQHFKQFLNVFLCCGIDCPTDLGDKLLTTMGLCESRFLGSVTYVLGGDP